MPEDRAVRRLLVANRGEIALRVMRTCREMGIVPIAIYGDGEDYAPHARQAAEAIRLDTDAPVPYLDIAAVVQAAGKMRADAIHPGYGFLAENAEFAEEVEAAGIVFIGPSPDAIRAMGDKIAARRLAAKAGLPSVPGTVDPVADVESAAAVAAEIGFPIAIKAAGGGGGRGFRVARSKADLQAAFEGASGEADRYFRNPEVYLERYLDRPRHVEIQVMADTHGNVVALGERECSIQRRHQKLIEESPSPAVDPDLRTRMYDAACALAREVGYVGAGTVEFLVDQHGDFSFLEMNTRIQVEHTVTEMVTGIDLVREQIQVAKGRPLSFDPATVDARGWAIECRINAEDPGRDFAPGPGTVTDYREPVGFGVRVDGALGAGDPVLPAYDSMIAKLVTWGRDRGEAMDRMRRALDDFTIGGVPTTLPFHKRVLASEAFRAGETSTSFLSDYPEVIPPASAFDVAQKDGNESTSAPLTLLVEVAGRRFETIIRGLAPVANGNATSVRRGTRRKEGPAASASSQDDLVSPIHGTVIRIGAADGDTVEAGQVIAVVEAMKMENELTAHKAGTLSGLTLSVGGTVSIGQRIAMIYGDDGSSRPGA